MTQHQSQRLLRSLIALLCAALLFVVMTTAAHAQDPKREPRDDPPTTREIDPALSTIDQPPRTGSFTATFTQRSPASAISKMKARMRYATAEPADEYELADESFEIYVPSNYDPAKAYGLIVWSSPTDAGSPLPQWLPILDKHDLIWIGANKAGNDRIGWYRFGLALDAAFNMKQQYHIDPDRVYISGMSGGGRISSRMGVAYADEFSGAFPIVGCDFYRRIPVPDQPGKVYLERYQPPAGNIFQKALKHNRYVLLTGSEDFNRTETQTIYEKGFVKEHFSFVTYLEVPGMAHALPPADWFEKGIDALDAPLAEIRAAAAQATRKLEADAADALNYALEVFDGDPIAGYVELLKVADRFESTDAGAKARAKAEAYAADPAHKAAIDAARNHDEAAQLMSMIDNYINAGRPDLAKQKLKRVVELVPGTDLAKEAEKRLKELDH